MRVAQVNVVRDPRLRTGEEILAAWPAVEMAARASADAGFETIVVQAAWRDEELERGGVRYRFAREAGGLAGRLRPRLPDVVCGLAPRVVHFQGLGSAQVRQYCGNGAAVVVHDHSDKVRSGPRRSLQRWALAQVDAALFTVAQQSRPFFEVGVLRPGLRIFEVLEATSAFTPGDVAEARARTGIDGDPCVLWLGHLDANKDPITILDAVSRVIPRLPGIRLWMCYGTGPLEAKVRARLAAEPALAERVTLLGRKPHAEVEHLCRAADFFVQGSRREASSFSVLESLACGVTPLVTDIPSLRRMTRNAAVGGLFPPGDAGSLARRLESFAARPRDELRREARAHFDRHLSPAALSRELATAYEAVAGAR